MTRTGSRAESRRVGGSDGPRKDCRAAGMGRRGQEVTDEPKGSYGYVWLGSHPSCGVDSRLKADRVVVHVGARWPPSKRTVTETMVAGGGESRGLGFSPEWGLVRCLPCSA